MFRHASILLLASMAPSQLPTALQQPDGQRRVWPIPVASSCTGSYCHRRQLHQISKTNPPHSNRLTGTVGLGSLVLRIAKPDGGDVPNINADCSYTRSYDARRLKGAATVTATSVFGAMYVMATFSQPATLLALRCNSATHLYVLARCSCRSMHSAVYIFTTLTFFCESHSYKPVCICGLARSLL